MNFYQFFTYTPISFCSEHLEITEGFLREHYCKTSVFLGFLEETYQEQLERELLEVREQLKMERDKNASNSK